MNDDHRLSLAARVRDACVQAALTGYEDAEIAGLCGEGALEAAISSIRRLDLDTILQQAKSENANKEVSHR